MAYKFQRGEAILSGALVQEGNVEIHEGFEFAMHEHTVLDTSRNLTVADMSGSGKLEVGGTVQLDGVQDAALDVAADSVYFLDSDGFMKKESFADLMASAVAGDNGLAASNGVLSIELHGDGGIEQTGDALQIKALGVTNSMLSGGIASDKIAELSAFDTADLAEGSNLYFTEARARASVSVTDVSGDGSLTYDSGSGVITYTGPSAAEVRAHLSTGYMIDVADGQFSIDAAEFSGSWDAVLATKDTGDLAEGSNLYYTEARWDSKMAAADTDDLAEGASSLYFTDARARAAVSVTDNGGDGALSYDSSTGVISFTGPSAAEVRAHFSGSEGIDLDAGAISVNVDDSSIEISADHLQVKALGITNDMLAGSIASSKIAELSAFDTADLTEGSNLYFTDARARAAVSVTDAGGDGSLSYDSATGVFTYTGPSADEVRAHLSVADTTSIDMSFASGSFSAAVLVDNVSIEIDDLDGLRIAEGAAGAGLAWNDGVLSVEGSVVTLKASNGVLSEGYNYMNDLTGAGASLTMTLPASGDSVAGDIVHVKAGDLIENESGPAVITINAASGQNIDGEASIVLESPFAAVSLVYVAANNWRIV